MVVWDNGTIHRRKDVKAYLWENRRRLETRRFPPYAPELNPDEQVWTVLKTPAVGELVSEDGGRDPGRSGTGAPVDAGAPRAGRLLHPALGVAAPCASVSAEVDRNLSTQRTIRSKSDDFSVCRLSDEDSASGILWASMCFGSNLGVLLTFLYGWPGSPYIGWPIIAVVLSGAVLVAVVAFDYLHPQAQGVAARLVIPGVVIGFLLCTASIVVLGLHYFGPP